MNRPLGAGDRVFLTVIPPLARSVIRLLRATLKIREQGIEWVEPFWRNGRPVIYAIWHGRMLMIPAIYEGRRAPWIMTSWSRDGELIGRVVRAFGFRTVRGSTTRGGTAALREQARLLRRGEEVGVLPDGPKGPRHVVQPGVVLLAKLSQAPIIPMSFSASPRRLLSSWDEFLLPLPFAHGVVVFGEPISVTRESDRDAIEADRKLLEERLMSLTWQADRLVGGP
ncbi:MAG: lysophospholipid acyltransferase family protein [Candidatus Rokubacteria bacterium]|nr:lysophospholipid acyltransferase family protein [Candidatus Rokubacteria bacterium]